MAPEWIGPVYIHNIMYGGSGPFTDFYFICRVGYQTDNQTDDRARFDVVLTFDSQLTSLNKTTTSASLDVIFTSQDIKDGFGNEVWLTLSSQQLSYFCSVHWIIICAVAYAKNGWRVNLNMPLKKEFRTQITTQYYTKTWSYICFLWFTILTAR